MPPHDADRNLLFGITALQNDFITRDALIAAMGAWALAKHRTIGEILVEAKALDPLDRDWLEGMFARRLAKHNDDPAQGLAAISSAGSVAEDLRRSIADPDILASIAQIPNNSQADPYATRAAEPNEPLPPGTRFRKVREHAAGNLGVVYVARDEELNRDVALKEIKERNADHPHNQAKFLLEAEVTGGLEHPGIVPVYGLGHHQDGRPYYAMRFIRGKSLLEAIKKFHADESLKKDPGKRLLELQKLLRRFTDVCNAIAYAHSRGVLHRDLKPDNVMVGKYGETLVVDWGLAKALGNSGGEGTVADNDDPLPEASLQPTSTEGLDATQAGTLVGTPAYMSPEQAAGRLDLLGPASDIYGLGATLYHLIVGRLPIEASNFYELLIKIQSGEITRPRSVGPWIDPALEAICLKALATMPADRYATPNALSEDLDSWIAGEPVIAYREPFARRARRWSKKHRTALTSTAAVVTVTLLLTGGYAGQSFNRRRTAEFAAAKMVDEADRLARKAQATGDPIGWIKAIAEAQRAVDQLELGGGVASEAKARLEVLKADSMMVGKLDEARIIGAGEKDGHFDMDARFDSYQAAFLSYGIDLASLPVEEAATMIRKNRIANDLIAALDDWASFDPENIPRSRLEAVARAADKDPIRISIREAVASRNTDALRRLCEKYEDRQKLGSHLRYVFKALLSLDPGRSFPLLESVRRESPDDFWLNQDLAVTYLTRVPQQPQEAARCLTAATALRPASPGVRVNLGNALLALGKFEDAIAEYRIAIRMKPELAIAHNNLGKALRDQGKIDEAITEYRSAIRMKPELGSAHYNLGKALRAQGRIDEAITEYRSAIRIEPEFAIAHNDFGFALHDQGKIDEAITEYRSAIRMKPELAEAHCNLGKALKDQGKIDEAIAEFRTAIRFKPELANAHNNLGSTLRDQGKIDEAITEYRSAIRFKPDLAIAHYGLASALQKQGDLEEAVAEYRSAIRIDPDAKGHNNLGIALRAQGKIDEAITEYRSAIRIEPEFAIAHNNLGNTLRDQGKIDEAITEYRSAIRFKPEDAIAHLSLGNAQRDLGRLDEAIAEYRIAIRIKPEYAEAYCNLGLVLRRQGLFWESLENLERGHELGSKRPDWRYPSAFWLRDTRRLVDLEAKIPTLLKREAKARDVAELLELADMCSKKRLHSASSRFWNEAFAEQPSIGSDLVKAYRYNAACEAVLAGTGSWKDDPGPDETSRATHLEKALGWLRADLAARTKQLEGADDMIRQEVAWKLAYWKTDPNLAGIRDEAALAKLPEAEREAFRLLWADVEALRVKAGGK